jgi:hypothetical protein
MEPYPECAKKPQQQPPTAQKVLQGLVQRERNFHNLKFNEFKTFEQIDIEKDKHFVKYISQYDLPTYNIYCKI